VFFPEGVAAVHKPGTLEWGPTTVCSFKGQKRCIGGNSGVSRHVVFEGGVGAAWAAGIGYIYVIAFKAFGFRAGEMEIGIANTIQGNAIFDG
jgi:hypothetical protein